MTTTRILRLLQTIPLILIVVLLLDLAMTGSASAQFSFPLRGHTGGVNSVAFSPDGNRILTGGSWDKTAKLWDAKTGQEIRTFLGHTGRVLSVAISPDGKRIQTGSKDGTAWIWQLEVAFED